MFCREFEFVGEWIEIIGLKFGGDLGMGYVLNDEICKYFYLF